jgi:hypothetical protein
MGKFVCPSCQKEFTRLHDMKRHHQNIHKTELPATDETHSMEDIINNGNIKKLLICDICHKTFTRKYSLKVHQENLHNITTASDGSTYQSLISQITKLKSELKERDELINHKIDELKNQTGTCINQNILNVICVTGHDNYLDMLTDRLGNFATAIDYIKDCALSDVSGDCRLIEKIYAVQNDRCSFTIDRKKSKITYHNENNETITEHKDVFGRKLANNLQNSYLKGINYLINRNLEKKLDPNQFLAEYDLLTWNAHIYNLSDTTYQRRMINQLSIQEK